MTRLLMILAALLLGAPAGAQALTCAGLATALATPQPAVTLTLARGEDCPAMRVAHYYAQRVTVRAGGATIRGLVVQPARGLADAGNVRVLGGKITAPGGVRGRAGDGYAVLARGARRVTLDGVLLTDATYGLVVQGGSDVTLTRSVVRGYRADGVQAARTTRLTVRGTRFEGATPDPTTCRTESAVHLGLSQRACLALPGAPLWTDGTHTDAVQMRGVVGATIADNLVRGDTAGIVDFRGVNDPPSSGLRVTGNDIMVSSTNPLALSAALDSLATGNVLARAPGSNLKAVLKLGPGVGACGNTAPDASPGVARCPDLP